MPLCDLTQLRLRNDDSLYHHFHYLWVASLANFLNRSFPEELGLAAICEKHVSPIEADVVTIDHLRITSPSAPEKLRQFPIPEPMDTLINPDFPEETKDIRVQTMAGEVIAIIELTSPGNKNAEQKVNNYVANATAYLRAGLHYLLIDPLPPTKFVDNFHNAIVNAIGGRLMPTPKNQTYYAISYRVKSEKMDVAIEVYSYWFGLDQPLPTVPLFLVDDLRIGVDLEVTFMEVLNQLPPYQRRILETTEVK
jgi:hypothetical protein